MENFSQSENLSKYCRICGKESKYLRNLHGSTPHGKTIAELINICTHINVLDESKPKCICMTCMTKLNTAYEFHNLVVNSDSHFAEFLAQKSYTKPETSFIDYSYTKPIAKHEQINVDPDIKPSLSYDELNHFDDDMEEDDIFVKKKSLSVPRKKPTTITKQAINLDTMNVFDLFESRDVRVRKPVERSNLTRNRKIVKGNATIKTKSNDKTITKVNATFECYQCKKYFATMPALQLHFQKHEASECKICMKKFAWPEYVEHLCTGDEIQCEYCSQSFKSIFKLNTHIESDHRNHKTHTCSKCPRFFHMKTLLQLHKTNHKDDEKKFVCDICNKRYWKKQKIKEHMETVHGDKNATRNYFNEYNYFLLDFLN